MALQLAPWLQPPDYLSAIDKGSQMGLGVVKANQQAWELNQRARQAQTELQQNWAAKMMADATQQETNRLTAQNRMDNLTYDQNRLNQTGASSAATLAETIRNNNRLGSSAAATLAENTRNHNLTLNKPMHLGAGSTVYNPQDGSVLFQTPPTDRPVNPLSDLQQADQKALLEKTAPVVTTHWFKPNETNAPPPLSQSDQAKLQFYQNRDAALIRQNPTPNAFPLQTNSLAPAADAWLGEGNTGNNPPQLAPPLSLTNSPAAGTGAYKVGGLYGKMRYMGGDANNPSSWRQE